MRTLEEIYQELRTAQPGKQARRLHKELKAYGDRLSLFDRYPYLAYILFVTLSATILAFVLVFLVVTILILLRC